MLLEELLENVYSKAFPNVYSRHSGGKTNKKKKKKKKYVVEYTYETKDGTTETKSSSVFAKNKTSAENKIYLETNKEIKITSVRNAT